METSADLQAKWDARHRDGPPPEPAAILELNAHLLPATGCALDLACGLGGNALFLAKRGLQVDAWDLSPVAIQRLDAWSRAAKLPLVAQVRDLLMAPPPPDQFDLICVSHFLDRDLFPALGAALRPGGLLFYQTWSQDRVTGRGPSETRYRLAPNELLALAKGLLIRYYREDGDQGDLTQGLRDLAFMVAQRPLERSQE